MIRLLLSAALLACKPSAEEPQMQQRHTLEGTVEAIRFQNINKAAGHFAYNVDLHVRVTSVDPPSPHPPAEVVHVRIRQSMGWKRLSAEEQAAVAPDGPKPQMTVSSFAGYTVGEQASVSVRFTSRDLAHTD